MIRIAMAIAAAVLAVVAPGVTAGGDRDRHKDRDHHDKGQRAIALPDEFRPEGIASGPKDSFFVGSIPQGSVYRGSYRTGEGEVLVPPHEGRNHTGLKVDTHRNLLFVAGGASKGIYVYDSETGEDVAAFSIPDAGFINDVVLTRKAAYFTDSQVQRFYRVEIGRRGDLEEPDIVPITGDFVYTQGFNANGIEEVGDGRRLIMVKSNTGQLYSVKPHSGRSREIELDGTVVNGDGILLRGDTLYVVRNRDNVIAVVDLKRDLSEGEIEDELTDPLLDVPTTIAPFERFIYAVNARFDRPDDSDDDIIRLRP
jgi:sugar lactone lactonase YvrE